MDWYICLFVSIILIILSIVIALSGRWKSRLRLVIAVVLLLIATFIIYCPFYFALYDTASSIFANMVNVMQVLSLDSNYLDSFSFITGQLPEAWAILYRIVMGLLHFALPIIAILGVYSLIAHSLNWLRIFWMTGHMSRRRPLFLFSESNEQTIHLMNDIAENLNAPADFIFMDSSKRPDKPAAKHIWLASSPDEISEFPFRVGKNNEQNEHWLKRDIYLFLFSENEDRNIDAALDLIDQFSGLNQDDQQKVHIYVSTSSQEIDTVLDSTNKDILDVRVINVERISVYNLLDQHPLFLGVRNGQLSILIVGCGRLCEEAMKAVVWCGQLNLNLKITVLTENAEKMKSRIQLNFPELLLPEYNNCILSCDPDSAELDSIIRENCPEAGYIIVCRDSDEENIQTALHLRRFFWRESQGFDNCPPLAACVRSAEKQRVIENISEKNRKGQKVNYNIIPFGCLYSIFSCREMIHSKLDGLAKNAHMVYSEVQDSAGQKEVNEKLKEYYLLEVNEESNWAIALHIRYKLWLLGLDYAESEDDNRESGDFEKCLKQYGSDSTNGVGVDGLEILARLEHDRWVAFERSEGWVSATVEQAKTYMKHTEISLGNHKCPALKMHPYICPFDELCDVSMEIENLTDPTEYDRKFISRIPDILGDVWNITGASYRIVKRAGK